MTNTKRITSLTLALIMIFSFAACAGAPASSGADSTTAVNQTDGKKIVDMLGREVYVPKDTAKNTVCTTYEMSPFFVTIQMSDRVLANTFKNKAFLRMVAPDILEAGNIGNINMDCEALAAYNPSVFICMTDEPDKVKTATDMGIPAIAIQTETPEEIMKVYEILGEAFGKEERAAQINKYFNDQLDNIKNITKNLKDEDKPTALVLGSSLGSVAGDDMLQTYMLTLAGAKPVVSGINNTMIWAEIGVEKVFDLDPDYIFITSSSVLDYVMEDITESSTWAEMKSVKSGKVFQIPAKKNSWDMPGPTFVLGTYYMLNKLHPDLFSDAQMQEKIDEYYMFMYGKTLSGEDIGY